MNVVEERRCDDDVAGGSRQIVQGSYGAPWVGQCSRTCSHSTRRTAARRRVGCRGRRLESPTCCTTSSGALAVPPADVDRISSLGGERAEVFTDRAVHHDSNPLLVDRNVSREDAAANSNERPIAYPSDVTGLPRKSTPRSYRSRRCGLRSRSGSTTQICDVDDGATATASARRRRRRDRSGASSLCGPSRCGCRRVDVRGPRCRPAAEVWVTRMCERAFSTASATRGSMASSARATARTPRRAARRRRGAAEERAHRNRSPRSPSRATVGMPRVSRPRRRRAADGLCSLRRSRLASPL